ncbi:hypothetical protein [Frondihabitans peucedani]|uniref:Uncharacterized protein n=1 Tax=Frondihabitans peucedani TaxID=598626 RepID=A0ABP8E172_9MICO
MVLYDARPVRLVGQIVLDLVVVAGIVVAVLLGRAVTASISGLAGIGTRVHDQGSAFHEQLSRAATAIGRIPFAGKAVSRPLRDASRSAASIAAAGRQQHDETIRLAHQVGTGVAVVVILLLVLVWLRYRGGFIRSASAARRLDRRPGGEELMALRALVTRDRAAGLGPDVVERWRQQDPETVRALADLERRSSGLLRATRR